MTELKCLFPGSSAPAISFVAGGDSEIVCNVPSNKDIDTQLVNIGVSFTSSQFGQTENLYITEDNQVWTYRYGPKVSESDVGTWVNTEFCAFRSTPSRQPNHR